MRALRLSWLFFKVGAMNELQYRVNFVLELLQSVLYLGVGLVTLALVYSHTDSLNGWSEDELLAVLGIQILMGGIIHAVIQPNMVRLMEEVRDGKLDHALTKPEDAQLLVSVREVRIWQAVDVLVGAVVLGVALSRLQGELGLTDVLAFAITLVLGGLMIYCFWLAITTVAFWVVRMEHVLELFEGVYQAGKWPVGIYPTWLRFGLSFIVPIAFAVTVPAESVTSRLDWQTLTLAVAVAAVLFVLTRWFFRAGVRRYSGASA
jgi:ABC-2 type transport system permease protein